MVDRYQSGSAMVLRSHHAIADGVRMVELAMSLFDSTPDGGPVQAPGVTLHATAAHPPGTPWSQRVRAGLDGARRQVGSTAAAATDIGLHAQTLAGAASAAAEEVSRLARIAPTNPLGVMTGLVTDAALVLGRAATLAQSALLAVTPGGGALIDLLSATPADLDVARKLLLGTRNQPTLWTGRAGPDKGVAWAEALPLAEVKAVARANAATVNDVLVACLAGSLQRYLESQEARCSSVSFMVPVNLKPLNHALPGELGNGFALVQLELPTDEPDPLRVLDTVKRRMRRIKHGHEAAVGFAVQETISGLSRTIYEAAVDLLANRSVGVLTNVPGPSCAVFLAGSRLEGIVGWAPLSGDQPLSVTIYSYDGTVRVGVACDEGLVPGYHAIVDGFSPVFRSLQRRSGQGRAT
jgi:diacylglycerol O-acyltransferase